MPESPNIVLGVTGSIAAYKAAELVRLMRKRNWGVRVIMTRCAEEFIGELTFATLSGNPVGREMFPETSHVDPEHISWAELADVILVAPCSANMLAKLAHGFADDLLSCTALAARSPVVVAPAMNDRMWDNPATQDNLKLLVSRGVRVVDVGSGDLACGYQGRGRLADLDKIMSAVADVLEGGSKGKAS